MCTEVVYMCTLAAEAWDVPRATTYHNSPSFVKHGEMTAFDLTLNWDKIMINESHKSRTSLLLNVRILLSPPDIFNFSKIICVWGSADKKMMKMNLALHVQVVDQD